MNKDILNIVSSFLEARDFLPLMRTCHTYNISVRLHNVTPTSEIGFLYNQKLPDLPNLTYLKLGYYYNQILPYLPNLTHLEMEHRYDKILPPLPNLICLIKKT